MGQLLTTSSQLTCPHGGAVLAVSSTPRSWAASSVALVDCDTFSVVGCTFAPGSPHPCVVVRWIAPATRLSSGGMRLVTTDSVGVCHAADGAPQGPVVVMVAQPKAEGHVMRRADYAYPFRVDSASGQVARVGYADHVAQLLKQLLLTAPGERVNEPEYGCGIRSLVFAGQTDALTVAIELQVRTAVDRWLGDQVRLEDVQVRAGMDPASRLDQGAVEVRVEYTLIETLSSGSVEVVVD